MLTTVNDQSLTYASCTVTPAPTQEGKLKEFISSHKLDAYIARKDMGNLFCLENKTQ